MLQVIGAGLPRTGTMSMKAALEHLGLGPCYHMVEFYAHPDHADRWVRADAGGPVDWSQVLAGYRSCQDWPAGLFWRELAHAYPQAKVVLTVRDPHQWYESFRRIPSPTADGRQVPEHVRPMLAARERLDPLLRRRGSAIFGDGWRPSSGGLLDEDAAVAAYRRHVRAVCRGIEEKRLLVFDVRQGWEPLCRFLGVDVPASTDFPHLNDSASLQRTFERLMTEGHAGSDPDSRW
ncbi:sulfotransferase family protein [Spirillospora sp. CA-253888]